MEIHTTLFTVIHAIIGDGDKMKKWISKILIVVLAISLTGCVTTSPKVEKHSFSSTNIGFDTMIELIAYTKDEATFNQYAETVKSEFTIYNQLFDKYNNYDGINNIKTINDNAGIAPVKVDPIIIEMLHVSKDYAEKSDGNFDVTLGAVLDLWHDHREANVNTKPSMEELLAAKELTGWKYVEINDEESTVYLNEKGVSLDVGGIAKGYAAELAAQTLEKQGMSSGILNAGGNVRLIGDRPETDYWTIGLENPDLNKVKRDSILQVRVYGNKSFVTSGDYQRGYEVDGVNMHHIIDPVTLVPARYTHSVTVITPDSGLADAISTVLFTSTLEYGLNFLEELRSNGMDIEAIWVFDEEQASNLGDVKLSIFDNYYVFATEGIQNSIYRP